MKKPSKKIMEVTIYVSKTNGRNIQPQDFSRFDEELDLAWKDNFSQHWLGDKWQQEGLSIDFAEEK
jgi:hypothetical protein